MRRGVWEVLTCGMHYTVYGIFSGHMHDSVTYLNWRHMLYYIGYQQPDMSVIS